MNAPATPMLLSRTCDLNDRAHLTNEYAVVDSYALDIDPMRRWECAVALHAIARWTRARGRDPVEPIVDVTWTLDPADWFPSMLTAWTPTSCTVWSRSGAALADLVEAGAPLADVVTCLSVVEHVVDLDQTLYYLSCALAPGGLLVLTTAYWNRCGADVAVDHDRRRRIFCPKTYQQLRLALDRYALTPFGGVDPTYHGPQRFDYSAASLIVEKRA